LSKISFIYDLLVDKKVEYLPTDLLKLSGQAVLLVLIIALLTAWPCWHFSGEQGMTALVLAAGVCLVSSCISLAPLLIAVRRRADWLAQACLGGTVIRLLLTLFIGTLVYFTFKPPMMTFALSAAAFYLGLLAWETKVAVGFIRVYYSRLPSTESEQEQANFNNKDIKRSS